MKHLKNWLINKLGGIPRSAIPPRVMYELLNIWADNTINRDIARTLMEGFETDSIPKGDKTNKNHYGQK